MNSVKKVLLLVFILSITLLALSASAAGSNKDRTMTIGIGITMDTMDPAQQTTATVSNVVDYQMQELLRIDQEGNLNPLLATSWSWSDDGKALTFKLRKDVTFFDGTPFNAKAVKFSLGRVISDKVRTPNASTYQVIKSIDVVDPYTVRFNLKHPDPGLLTMFSYTVAAIIAPSSLDKGDNSYANIRHPIGTGPYELVSRQRGSKLVFKRNKDYWGKQPYYNKVVFRIVPESNALEAGLRSGQLDMIMNPPVSDLKALQAQSNITVQKFPSDRSIFIALVTNKPPFNNKKVRKAVNYAVDKQAIIKSVLFGAAKRLKSPFSPLIRGQCNIGGYDYNPKKAKKLLAEAGASDLSITLGTPRGRYTQDFQAAQAIASYLRKVGINVKVRTRDWASYVSLVGGKDKPLNAYLFGWASPGANFPFEMITLTKAAWPPKGLNGGFYSDPKVEKLLAKGRLALNKEKRHKNYCQVQKLVWDDAPWIFLWSQYLVLAYNSNITGISTKPSESFVTIYAHPKDVSLDSPW